MRGKCKTRSPHRSWSCRELDWYSIDHVFIDEGDRARRESRRSLPAGRRKKKEKHRESVSCQQDPGWGRKDDLSIPLVFVLHEHPTAPSIALGIDCASGLERLRESWCSARWREMSMIHLGRSPSTHQQPRQASSCQSRAMIDHACAGAKGRKGKR